MGIYSERLATTITSQLIEWRLRSGDCVEGIIYNCTDRHAPYRDGDKFIFMNARLTHYPHCEGFWSDHFVLSTQTGYHFMLLARDQYAPMA